MIIKSNQIIKLCFYFHFIFVFACVVRFILLWCRCVCVVRLCQCAGVNLSEPFGLKQKLGCACANREISNQISSGNKYFTKLKTKQKSGVRQMFEKNYIICSLLNIQIYFHISTWANITKTLHPPSIMTAYWHFNFDQFLKINLKLLAHRACSFHFKC